MRKGARGAEGGSFKEGLNFDYTGYMSEVDELAGMTQDAVALHLRRGGGTRAPTSAFRGVSCVPDRRRWQANFRHNGRDTRLGQFVTEEGAARAFDCIMVWFKLHEVQRKGGTALNFYYAEYGARWRRWGA